MLVVTKDGKSWTTDFYPVSGSDIHLVRSGEFKYFRFSKEKNRFEQMKITKRRNGKFEQKWIKVSS